MSDLKMDILELQPIPGTKEKIEKLDDELKSISEKLGPILDLLSVLSELVHVPHFRVEFMQTC